MMFQIVIYHGSRDPAQLVSNTYDGPMVAQTSAMAYVITSPCVATCDTACVYVCPCDCIAGPLTLEEIRAVPEGDRAKRFPDVQLFIDPDHCIDCGACEPECPVSAIFLDEDVPAAHEKDIERNASFFRGR